MHLVASPGPPGIIPWGGGPIIGIIGGPPIGGVGSMPGRGGPPGLFTHTYTQQDVISARRYNCVLFSITSLNLNRLNEPSKGGLTWGRTARERRGSDLPLLECCRCWGKEHSGKMWPTSKKSNISENDSVLIYKTSLLKLVRTVITVSQRTSHA